MFVVVDTNILVSSLWSRDGEPARFMALVVGGVLTPCWDSRIMNEYREVLLRPKFRFDAGEVDDLLSLIRHEGLSVLPTPLDVAFSDVEDRKFYEVAVFCNALLVTGNVRHYPNDGVAITVGEFFRRTRLPG